ncbi:MAG: alpha-amylase family glycosyl hydrolase [Myxococcota bacterium]
MRRSFAALVPLLGLLGCEPEVEGIPEGECAVVLWAQPQRSSEALSVRGSWNVWGDPVPMRRFDGRWRVAEFSLPPGEYGYQIVEADQGRLDATHGLTRFRESDGQEVSWMRVEACDAPRIATAVAAPLDDDGVTLQLDVIPSRTGAPLDVEGVTVAGASTQVEATDDGVAVQVRGLPQGKHSLEVTLRDVDGATATQTVDAWVRPRAQTQEDQIIYQVMIDRFRGDDGSTLQPPPNAGARAGGTLAGITAELEAGTFDALAVTTLWLSPVYVNPVEARAGTDGQMYEGYHGYWPVDSRGVDERIGGEAALRALIDAAHSRGIRVLLDLVPNHVYETNPRYAEYQAIDGVHPDDPMCVCGTDSCPWDRFIKTCWFVPYLPDLRFEAPGVLDLAVEDARWWQETYDLDGFRVDAVPMMPRAVTRRIVTAVQDQVVNEGAAFSLGEIFTGPGTAGTESLRFYLGPDALDSAFDFPLMWALRDALALGGPGFDAVEASLTHTEEATAGSGSVMSLMVGNHDVTRFASEAVGDAGNDPWGSDLPIQPDDADPYVRQAIAMGLVMTLPGAPVIYYGDEVGLAGGRDPDSRRVMPDESELLPPQVELRDTVRRLAQARACLPALRRGERVPLHASADTFAFMRDAGDSGPVVVLAHRGATADTIAPGSRLYPGAYRDLLSGEVLVLDAETEIELPPWSLRVLAPAAHPCAE